MDEVKRVRRAALILEQAGFGDRYTELESRLSKFAATRRRLETAVASGRQLSQDEADDISSAALAIDEALQALLLDLEPQLRKVIKDPFKEWV